MRGKLTLIAGLIATVIALPVLAEEGEQERTVPARSFDRFDLETATADGFWFELGGFYERTSFGPDDVEGLDVKLDAWTAFARAAYGGEKWEAGAFIPYRGQDGRAIMDADDTQTRLNVDDNGIGDIQVYGKYIPLDTELLDAGAGVRFSLPSGDDNKGLGTGELGALPFFTAAFNLAFLEARGHVGWEFFTGDNDDGQAYDRLVYGFGLIMPLFDRFSMRHEFVGEEMDTGDKPKVVNYVAGLDIRIPIGRYDLLLRPTGLAGINSRAPNWGVGGSIAITSPTFRPAKGGGYEYGGVIVE
jgi:hypothetical protein